MSGREIIGVFLAILWASVTYATPARAVSLTVSPLKYDVSLAAHSSKKGFVDITNPGTDTEIVNLEVQAFRQTNDSGALEFYQNDVIRAGIQLDYNQVELGPRETLHLAFIVDGSNLPSGDVFAAILASVAPNMKAPAVQTVQVGTLLMISNGQPSRHDIRVEQLSMHPLQVGDGVGVRFLLRNPDDAKTLSGFAPKVTVSMWPYINETVDGPLVFAGRTRQIDFVKRGDYLGVMRLTVSSGASQQSGYAIVVTGYWRWVVPIAVILIVTVIFVWLRRSPRRKTVRRKHPLASS